MNSGLTQELELFVVGTDHSSHVIADRELPCPHPSIYEANK